MGGGGKGGREEKKKNLWGGGGRTLFLVESLEYKLEETLIGFFGRHFFSS